MKLLFLKILLQRRAKDEGFTLPMVIAIGLVMLLLGTVNIAKSNEENIAAISKNSSSDAFAIAEVGIAKYRELLNQNRILTINNHDQWNALAAQACSDLTTTPIGWIPQGAAAPPSDTTQWWQIGADLDGDGTDEEVIGQYRLVSYEYDNDGLSISRDEDNDGNLDDTTPNNENGDFNVSSDVNPNYPLDTTQDNDTDDDGESDAIGILTVQGQSTDGSQAQIQVEIPLRVNDLETFAPALWIGSGSLSDAEAGVLNIPSDNIVLSDNAGGCTKPADINSNNVISDPRNIPAVIDPDAIVAAQKNIIPSITLTAASLDDFLLPQPNLPPNEDNQHADDRYIYDVATVSVADKNLLSDGVAKVNLYVRSALNIVSSGGTVTVGNDDSRILARFNAANSNVSSHNLEIYGAPTLSQINIDTGAGGTVNIEAFIHAPNATLNVTGTGTLNINGAVWVSRFNNQTGAIVNIRGDRTDTATSPEVSYKFYTSSANRVARPVMSSPTNWVKQEVQ